MTNAYTNKSVYAGKGTSYTKRTYSRNDGVQLIAEINTNYEQNPAKKGKQNFGQSDQILSLANNKRETRNEENPSN